MALSPKQQVVAITLSQGKTQAQAAAEAGCGLRTVQRWVTQPEFQEYICQSKRESYQQAISKLVSYTTNAVAVLDSVAADVRVPASTRVAAAKVILDSAIKAYGQEELERRVSELEEKLKP
jgi:N-acyl-D-aspartate/D-glutamate deacylase